MKRVHFDSKGPVKWHHYFWEPWGCFGCLWRCVAFMVLLSLFLFLLSQFRSCQSNTEVASDRPVSVVVPPINEDDVIDEDGHQVVSNRINVLFDAETGTEQHDAWIARFHELYPGDDYQILFFDPETKLMSIQVPPERRVAMIRDLPSQIPDIPFLVFDESVMDMGLTFNDPVFRHSDHAYHFGAIHAPEAWDISQGDPDVTVAVVDSYFDLDNIEFASTAIRHPWSVARGDTVVALPPDYDPRRPNPVYAHGTMVAGFVLAAAGNGRASAGIAPRCSLMPISLGHRFGCLAMLQGILVALNHRATVINISAGMAFTEEISQLSVDQQISLANTELLAQENVWRYVFAMAQRNYVTLVWAAGNEDVFTALDASKRGENTIRVSATDAAMRKAEFSNFGNFPQRQIMESTVSAPGVQVPGLVPGTSGYMLVDGTSFSAPIVAGAVGLIKSVDPTLTTAEIIEVLQRTGSPVEGSTTIGPVVNAAAAVETVERACVSYTDLAEALHSGRGANFRLCDLNYLAVDDNSLPPIFTVDFRTTGIDSGELTYSPNRDNIAPSHARYTIRRQGDNLEMEIAPTDAGGNTFGAASVRIRPNSRGKAEIFSVDSDWWQFGTPCRIKTL